MDLFALNDDVARWEAALPLASGYGRLEVLVALAWYSRQRDTRRAVELANQAETQLSSVDLPDRAGQAIRARLQLVHGEAQWLYADLAGAEGRARRALQEFDTLQDWAGCADAHWLLAWIAVDSGRLSQSDIEFETMVADASRAGDAARVEVAETALARWAVLRNPRLAQERWGTRFGDDARELDPALATWRYDYLGMLTHYTGDAGMAATYIMKAYEAALASGQIRPAITAATNVAEGFNRLNDHQMALEWMQRALDLARPTGWPRSLGACQMHMAETLRYLGNQVAAQDLLREAIATLAPIAGSRTYAIALQYQGDLALDRQDYSAALGAFLQLERKANELQQQDFYTDSRRGQAHALSGLGRPEEALTAAGLALAGAQQQGDVSRQIETLMVLADIHASYPHVAPASPTAESAPLRYLQQALAVSKTVSGYTTSGKLLEALSREYAAVGNFALAYQMATQALSAREKTHGQETTNRAIAIQVVNQTERARAEGAYHRQLAASEAQRAEVLLKTTETLEHLGAIGQEITTHLDAAAIFQVLDRHVHRLLDVSSFAIYLVDVGGERMTMAFGVEEGKPLPHDHVAMSDPTANSARCVRERRELLCDLQQDDGANYIPGTLYSLSALYTPLAIGDRLLGVMTIQSLHRNAYADRDRLIFRTLCAYAAIALDNAQTYRQLEDTQQQLLAQQKMAALGSLVAGVAHELNTPIGNSVMIASTMSSKTEIVVKQLQENTLRRSELLAYLAASQEASELTLRGLHSAADLVASFKQVAVDRTTAQRRVYDLKQLGHEIVATMMNRIKHAGHTIELDIPDFISMNSYPGPLGQVIANFINNAILHAFHGREGGRLVLSARTPTAGRVRIEFKDNGDGIDDEHLHKIFDPFFTTKFGQGGSGLGLSISYNIVTSLLRGQISVESKLGMGTMFVIEVPLVVPG